MKLASALALTLALVALAACTPAAQEEPAAAPTGGAEPEKATAPALSTVPAEVEATASRALAPVQGLPPNMDVGTAAAPSAPESGVAPPSGTVDVGQLTPELQSGEGGPLIEQPEPGLPDAQVKMVELARQDAAARLGVDISQVRLLAVEEKQWPDAGLGCPSIGTVQAQVVTPGFLITLEAGGNFLTYHTDMAKRLLLCVDAMPDLTQ